MPIIKNFQTVNFGGMWNIETYSIGTRPFIFKAVENACRTRDLGIQM